MKKYLLLSVLAFSIAAQCRVDSAQVMMMAKNLAKAENSFRTSEIIFACTCWIPIVNLIFLIYKECKKSSVIRARNEYHCAVAEQLASAADQAPKADV